MTDEKFDAIIIGAGPAGSTAAYLLAKEGLNVLLIEKGTAPGAKNMFGGRMYAHALHRIIPEFWKEAPVERPVVQETITFLNGNQSVSVACNNTEWAAEPCHSFTLLRAEFDAWLASKAEEAGAFLACGIRVDELLTDGGKVVGIKAGDDEMFADVVVAADGVNSILAQKAGWAKMFAPSQVATGVKEVIELPTETISQRFQLEGNNGAVRMFVGDCTNGMQGGGFLYTNKSSVSLGLVINAGELQKSQVKLCDIMEDFKGNPHIAPLIEGGQVAEYSAHLVPEAGLAMMPQLYGDGMLVAGDAAGFVLNLGYTVRGMDFAVASGEAAAKAITEANARKDFSRQSLGRYEELLKKSFVLRDLEAFRKAPEFMENERMFAAYPKLATSLATRLFTVDGAPPVHLMQMIFGQIRKSGISPLHLARDSWKGVKNL